MNSEQKVEHFASLCAGCASQRKLNRSTKAGIKILYLHFILIRPDFIIFALKFSNYEFPLKPSLYKGS